MSANNLNPVPDGNAQNHDGQNFFVVCWDCREIYDSTEPFDFAEAPSCPKSEEHDHNIVFLFGKREP